jgi:putative ATP-binding cassette transporter
VFVAMILGALAGLSYSLIIPLVLSVLDPESGSFATVDAEIGVFMSWQISHYPQALLFTFICVFILVARTASQVILTRISMDLTTDLRTRMYHQIADAPIADLERIGHSKLVASITADVPVIIAGARLLPDLLTNAVTLIGMLGFLFYLNSKVFWFVMGCILFGVVTYQLPMLVGRRYLVRARRHLDGLHEAIRGLVYGAKELKLSSNKREDYFQRALAQSEAEVRDAGKTGHTIMRVAMNYGNLIVFFVIGAVSFVFVNHYAISRQELSGVIMALLYVTAPVGALLNFIPQFATAQVAMRRMTQLFEQIPREQVRQDGRALREWHTLRFEAVTYRYPDNAGEASFGLGPLTFDIRRGEITFIVGGNGSGKSTLSKLITLHYHPAGGAIYFDDQRVDATNLAGFRAGVAAIYSDYHLFDRTLGVNGRDVQGLVDDCLKALALDHKVRFKEGRFSTLRLSDGQRRRLALIAALVDDAELYLFDEWAADQDPAFKAVFYDRILPSLKAKGKAVVAVLHDDRYFHLADRVITLNEGHVEKTSDLALAPAVKLASGHAS